jgi:DNA-binding cell septation regulator SpoVG
MKKPIETGSGFMQNDMAMIFLSLLLVLITFFLVLTRFVEPDPEKISRVKKDLSTLLFFGRQSSGKAVETVVPDMFSPEDPIASLLNRMKAIGMTEPLMNQFISLKDIKNLKVISGESGLVIRMPKTIKPDGADLQITEAERDTLGKMAVLFRELPFIIDIKGVSGENKADGPFKSLQMSVRASQSVYSHLLQMGIQPEKLKVTGLVVSRSPGLEPTVEISFRENI